MNFLETGLFCGLVVRLLLLRANLSGRRSERICGAQTNQCYELGYSDCVS